MATDLSNSGLTDHTETERIVLTADTCRGKPRIAGSRIRVQDIYWWHEVEGKSADEIVTSYPQLSMADVYAALSYFWSHRDTMLAELQADRLSYEEQKRSAPSLVAEKLKSIGHLNVADDSVSS